MNNALTIARREMSSLFYSPIGYVVLGVFTLGTTLWFNMTFAPGQPATLQPVFLFMVYLLIFLAPAISMRLVSEELKHGTIELLMTAPVSDEEVVVGKWLGAMGFFCVLLSPLLVFIGILEAVSEPDYGPIISGLIGLVLVGGFYMAVGLFASSLTDNQIISFIVAVFIIMIFTVAMAFVPYRPDMPEWIQRTTQYLNVNAQYEGFAKGVVELSNVVYFLSGTLLFLFIAMLAVESRRWR